MTLNNSDKNNLNTPFLKGTSELYKADDSKQFRLEEKVNDIYTYVVKEITITQRKVNDLNHKDKLKEEEIKNLRKENIELIGLFVAIFTFISVEITILKYANNSFTLFGLSLILLGAIIFLLSTLVLILDKNIFYSSVKNFLHSKYPVLVLVSLIVLIAGCLLGVKGQKLITEDQVYQQQIKDLNDKLNSTNETIDLLNKHIQVVEKLNNLE